MFRYSTTSNETWVKQCGIGKNAPTNLFEPVKWDGPSSDLYLFIYFIELTYHAIWNRDSLGSLQYLKNKNTYTYKLVNICIKTGGLPQMKRTSWVRTGLTKAPQSHPSQFVGSSYWHTHLPISHEEGRATNPCWSMLVLVEITLTRKLNVHLLSSEFMKSLGQ